MGLLHRKWLLKPVLVGINLTNLTRHSLLVVCHTYTPSFHYATDAEQLPYSPNWPPCPYPKSVARTRALSAAAGSPSRSRSSECQNHVCGLVGFKLNLSRESARAMRRASGERLSLARRIASSCTFRARTSRTEPKPPSLRIPPLALSSSRRAWVVSVPLWPPRKHDRIARRSGSPTVRA